MAVSQEAKPQIQAEEGAPGVDGPGCAATNQRTVRVGLASIGLASFGAAMASAVGVGAGNVSVGTSVGSTSALLS